MIKLKNILVLLICFLFWSCGNNSSTQSSQLPPVDNANQKPQISETTKTPENASNIATKPDQENPSESIINTEYQKFTFKNLNSYRLLKKMQPSIFDTNAGQETIEEKAEQINKQIPEEIRKLSGTNIEIEGYAVPLKLAKGKAKDLILMCVVPSCCYGDVLRSNDLIYVFAPKNEINVKENQHIKVKGKLTVDVKPDQDQSFMFIYWLNADSVEAIPKAGLLK